MQTNLLWTGREYHSLENCLVNTSDIGSEINSMIIGTYDEKIYRIEYKIKTDQNWATTYLEVQSQHSNQRERLICESDGNGNWIMNGERAPQFEGCLDVDVSLTPFTNSLPINRLRLAQGDQYVIRVIYVDLLDQQILPVKQKYTRVSNTEYQYENVPNDFEARIKVDELGFVVDYPPLFIRTAKLTIAYQ